MNALKIVLGCFCLLYSLMVKAGEFQVGISYVPMLSELPDLHINYRPSQSHFQFGYKYQRWSDTFVNGVTNQADTQSNQTRSGPIMLYLSDIESNGTGYYGIELLQYSASEQAIAPGGANESVSNNDLYFGGGITGHWGANLFNDWNGNFYYNFGFFIGPTADTRSPSQRNTGTSGGSFDIQLQLGFFF